MIFELGLWQLLLATGVLLGLGFLLGYRKSPERQQSVLVDNKELTAELESVKVSANQLETALDHVELLHRSKNQFYYTTSHDLRQPLHALEMFSSVLQKQPLNATSAEIVRDISEVVKDITRETEVLLDIARVDVEVLKLHPVEFDLGVETRRIVNQFRRAARVKSLQLKLTSSNDQFVVLDRVLFDRILRNLIDNAIKFTDAGFVKVSVDYGADRTVNLSVVDSGIGIGKEDQEDIYREFYQGKKLPDSYLSGAGIGLNSVLKMVQRMSGKIAVESPTDNGTSVTVSIPNVLPGAKLQGTEVNETKNRVIDPALKTILVYQSDGTMDNSTALLIESSGYNVISTSSLSEAYAVQKSNTISAACLEFSGSTNMVRKFLETLRLLNPGMPIVVLISGNSTDNFFAGLSVSVLQKPVDARLLLDNIRPLEESR